MMDADKIKADLKNFYNQEATIRNANDKQEWKLEQRLRFLELIRKEQKKTLLEIGAGTGQDSIFFMDNGLAVTAVDLSKEMIDICKGKNIKAFEMDFYNLSSLKEKFDCIWSMNSLLHVPKTDLSIVLNEIDLVLNKNGLFYMGVYGGEDIEKNYVNDIINTQRFFSFYSEKSLKEVLSKTFDIVSFQQIDVGRNTDFQAVILKKK